jgi:NADH:ubiquinone oxidoreductase subunit F (NADH-binding)
MNFSTCRALCAFLFILGFAAVLHAADKTASGKIEVTLMGEVVKTGKIQLPASATIDDAFAAAGGFDADGARLQHHGGPAIFCILMTRDQGVDFNMHVPVKVDRKTGTIRVTDKTRRTVPLKDGDTVIFPVITR